MSFENGGSNSRWNTDGRILEVSAHQGNVNQGFHPDHPQTPPPKYEDVISGEYLKQTDISYIHSPSRTEELTSVTGHYTNPQADITQSDPTPEDQTEECKLSVVWAAITAVLVVILIWTTAIKTEDAPNRSGVCNSPRRPFYNKSFVDYTGMRRKMATGALISVLFVLVIYGL